VSTAVIVAHAEDIHAHAVKEEVNRLGFGAYVLDVQEFTSSYDLITRIGASGTRMEIRSRDGDRLDLSEISGLWWRRLRYPLQPAGPDAAGGVFQVVSEERRAALVGSLCGLVPNAFNDLGRSRQAAHKPTQLVRARDLGLHIPETLITNYEADVREFCGRDEVETIYKMFTGSPFGLHGTRRLDGPDMHLLDRLHRCPAIFQEYVDGEYDIRAVVVGDEVFAARIDYDRLADTIDTRFVDTTVSTCSLPPDLTRRLVQLVHGFGLVYSSIDLRYSKAFGYTFFESNPEGQYLWLEIETGLPISRAIARRLTARGIAASRDSA
jgi:hypothetical protein